MRHLASRIVGGSLFFTLFASLATPGWAAPEPKTVPFTVEERPGEVRLTTDGYALSVTREGFAWTLYRGSEAVLLSAPPKGVTANGSLIFDRLPEPPGTLQNVEKLADRIVLQYAHPRRKTHLLVELEPRPDRVRVTTIALNRDTTLHEAVSTLRFQMAPSGYWYGGGFQGWRDKQVLPLNQARINTPGFIAFGKTQASPFWYSTKGVGVWVRTPQEFGYSVNGLWQGRPDGLISVVMRATHLTYELLVKQDIREVVQTFLQDVGYPKKVPPAYFFRDPIYTTWVEHKVPVDQEKVLVYARAIKDNNLPCGIIEIDDKWEVRYGDMEFDKTKFPNPKAMVDEIHRMGMKVTLWVHPFVNTNSETFAKLRDNPKLLHDATGNVGRIFWWNGNAAIWDFSRPDAVREFRSKLRRLQARYGIDGFKFDGADSEMFPQEARAANGMNSVQYADVYNREITAAWPLNETRVGIYSQPLGIVQRLIDKHSIWGPENGLQALVPEMIIISLRGYPYAMPDMVGGNQYENDRIDKELMIRWAQASALMPLLQFSVGPWHFDKETVDASREASELHVRFAPVILDLARQAPRTGEPILASLWYHHPKDPNTHPINDQFMLGKDVVVAPVVAKGARARNIYLPAGTWKVLDTDKTLEGGKWLKDYPAPLASLPVFIREGSAAEKLTAAKPKAKKAQP